MATVYWIVDTANGDWPEYAVVYTNLETAMASAYDLVTAQESLVIDCIDSSGTGANPDTTAVVVDGWTTSVNYTLTIQAHKSQRHGGVWNDEYYRQSTLVSATTFTLSTQYATIDGLQLLGTSVQDYKGVLSFAAGSCNNSQLINCFLSDVGISATAGAGIYIADANNTLESGTIVNNIIKAAATVTRSSVSGIRDRLLYDSALINNNIIYGFNAVGNIGIYSDASSPSSGYYNNISIGNDVDFYMAGSESADYNVSSDLTAPGTNTVQSFDHSTLFPNAATGDFRPAISYVSALGTTWGAGAIPWQRNVLVDTNGGGDYPSLAEAEAGEQTIGDDLALRNEKLVISCTSGGTTTADTTAVTIDANWNTSESCDFTVQAHANDRHQGVWDDSKYVFEGQTYNYSIYSYVDYFHLLNLQFNHPNGNSGNDCIKLAYTNGVSSIIGNLIKRSGSQTCAAIAANTSSDSGANNAKILISNNILLENTTPFTYGIYVNRSINTVCNNTVISCATGINTGAVDGSAYVYNNNCLNCTTDYIDGGTLVDSITNISSDGTAPDNSTSYTVYDAAVDTLPVVPEDCVIFKDITNNDFRLVSHKVENYKGEMVETNSAISNGTWLYDIDDDCAGKSREPYQFKGVRTARAFDIGAWQAPVQLTYVVDTDNVHGDYANLATAFTGLQADSTDIVTDNMLPTISCQATTGVADTSGQVILSGIATTEDTYLTIDVPEGHRHLNKWDSSKYLFIGSIGYSGLINSKMPFSEINNIQIENTHDYGVAIRISIEGLLTVNSVLGKSPNNDNTSNCVFSAGNYGYGPLICNNCIALQGSVGFRDNRGDSVAARFTQLNNCTEYGCINPTNLGYGTETTDCILHSGITVSVARTNTNMVTGNTSAIGTNPITGLSSTYFTDPANGDFTPVASAGTLTTYSASLNSTVSVGAIPFVDEKIVDTGGTGDYTNLATWESYADGSCVAGETARALCKATTGQPDNGTGLYLDGWDSSVEVEIIADRSSWHNWTIDNGYRLTSSGTHNLRCLSVGEIYLDGIAFDGTGTTYGVGYDSNPLCSIKNCLLWYTYLAGSHTIAENSIVVNSPGKAASNIKQALNCTSLQMAGFGNSLGQDFRYILCTNCLAISEDQKNYSAFYSNTSLSSNNVESSGCIYYGSDILRTETSLTPAQIFKSVTSGSEDLHTTDSPYELWGANAAYAGAFGDSPYEVLRTVDTDGVSGDHASLSAAVDWFKTNRTDLVTRNEKALITCAATTGVGDGIHLVISGIVTDDAHFIDIRAALGHEHLGVWGAGYKFIADADYSAISVDSADVHFKQLSFDTINSHCIRFTGDRSKTSINVDGVFCKDAVSYGVSLIEDLKDSIVKNSIFWGCDRSVYSGAAGTVKIFNCISSGANYGFGRGNIQNCISVDSVNADYLLGNQPANNNIDSDGTGNITDTALNLFTNAASGDFTLKSTATNAIGTGTDLSAQFTDDITGATREAPWDIGAFKYVDLGGGVTLTVNPITGVASLSAPTLSSAYDLTVASLASSATVEQLTLIYSLSLIMQDLISATSLAGTTLASKYNLTLGDLSGLASIDQVTLASKYNLTPADLASISTIEQLVVDPKYALLLADLSSNSTLEQPSISSQYLLAMHDLLSAGLLDNITLSSGLTLILHDLSAAASIGNIELVQKYLLQVADMVSGTSLKQLVLSLSTLLVVNDIDGLANVDAPSLLSEYLLSVNDAISASVIDNIGLLVALTLIVDDLAASSVVDNIVLSLSTLLNINDLSSSSLLSSQTLSSKYQLAIHDILSASILDSPSLSQWVELVVDSLNSAQILDSDFNLSFATLLIVDSLGQTSTLSLADLINLEYNLTVSDLLSASSIVKLNLILPADGYVLIIRAKNKQFSIQGEI